MSIDRTQLTKKQRWELADQLARDRLPVINASLSDVHPNNTFYTRYGKRILDISLSFVSLLLTIPVNLIIAFCTLLDVGKPILFHQERLGKDGKIIKIMKFRNMKNTKDERGELLPPSQRVTKFGKLMRKTSLDELLNFWSIFKGDMSVIGPRPLVPEYYHRYNKRHKMRMAVRPGLECPPRDNYDHVWTWHEQFENDIWYVEHVSFKTDCIMCWKLLRFALDRKSNTARATSARGTFMGYSEDGKVINLEEIPQDYIDMFFQDISSSEGNMA